MAKATKKAAPKKAEKSAKDEKGDITSVIEQFSSLSSDARIKLAPQLATAANQDANLKSTGTEESTAHYDDLINQYGEEETDEA